MDAYYEQLCAVIPSFKYNDNLFIMNYLTLFVGADHQT